MVGGRKTHNFPHGTPRLLTVSGISFGVMAIAAMVLGDMLQTWRRFVPFVAVGLIGFFAHSLLLRHYERTGQAIPIPRKRVVVRFSKGLPLPMLVARGSFFVTVTTMLFFGATPMPVSMARIGIIACVFTLIAVAFVNIGLERHYVNSGTAEEIELAGQHFQSDNK